MSAGCRTGPFLERMSNVTGIAESYTFRNLIHVQVGFAQEIERQLEHTFRLTLKHLFLTGANLAVGVNPSYSKWSLC